MKFISLSFTLLLPALFALSNSARAEVHMDADPPKNIQDNFKKEDFRPYMLKHFNEGCPTNSSCSKEMGQLYKKWSEILKSSEGSMKQAKILEAFRATSGIPFDIWLLDLDKKYPNLISWGGNCKYHNRDGHKQIHTALALVKNISDLNELEDKDVISIRTLYRKTHDGKMIRYQVPIGETPLYFTNKDAIFQRSEEGHYYGLSISPKGELHVIDTQSPREFPRSIDCPKSLYEELKTQLESREFNRDIYAGFICQRTWNVEAGAYDTLLYGWSCD